MPHQEDKDLICLQKEIKKIHPIAGVLEFWSGETEWKLSCYQNAGHFSYKSPVNYQHDFLEQIGFFNTPLLQHSSTPGSGG